MSSLQLLDVGRGEVEAGVGAVSATHPPPKAGEEASDEAERHLTADDRAELVVGAGVGGSKWGHIDRVAYSRENIQQSSS